MPYCREMEVLDTMLTIAKIPHNLHSFWDGFQLCYPDVEDPCEAVCDVIWHSGSYGFEKGLLEMMGLVDTEAVGDDVEGYITGQEAFRRIFAHFCGDEEFTKLKTSKETLNRLDNEVNTLGAILLNDGERDALIKFFNELTDEDEEE